MILKDKNASSLVDEEANERSSLLNTGYYQLIMRLHQALGQETIFESIGNNDPYFRTWQKEIHPILCEVALKPDQINQLFKSIEKGGGRSLLGKAKDTLDKGSDLWFNKFGGMLQSSGPIQAFDQKYERIKSSIATKNPKIAASLSKYAEFAKNNPKLHKFLLAIAGSVAAALGVAVAGGVGAGALSVGTGVGIATGIINIADRLLQGQKASTAIGRGATTGAIAGLTAAAASKIAGEIADSFRAEYLKAKGANNLMKGTFDLNGQWTFVTGKAEDVRMLSRLVDNGDMQGFYNLVSQMRTPEYVKGIDASREVIQQAAQHYKTAKDTLTTLAQVAAAGAGGAASAATSQKPASASLSKNKISELFGFTGNKIDADKLDKAWKKAGSPVDSEDIKQILQDKGIDDAIIDKAFQDIGVEISTSTQNNVAPKTDNQTVNTQEIVARIKKLTPAQQKEILALLGK